VNPFSPGSAEYDEWDRQEAEEEERPASDDKDDRSTSDILADLAESLYQFGVSTDDESYGVPTKGPRVVLMLRGGKTSLRGQLAAAYRRQRKKVAPQQALANAMLCIEGIAQEAEPVQLHQRVADHDGALWLDLGDHAGRAVCITGDGWTVEDAAPVLFKRTALTAALPTPVRGGNLNELWSWLNVTEEDRPLIAAAMVSALWPDIPHPVLGLTGEQGTGKTTATKVIVSVLDPSPVPCRKAPKDAEAWVTAAAGSWVVALENLSYIPDWLSDSICRAVTGDGDVRRKLYTDADLAVFAFRRFIVANGIDFGTLRGDLADRMLPIELDVIGETERLEESEFWPRWSQAHPRILGALLDLACGVLRTLPSVHLGRKPRMADFARRLAAVDQVLGTTALPRYLDKQASLAVDSLTGDPFIMAMRHAVDFAGGTFTGTSAELLAKVTPDEQKRPPKGWPESARQVTSRLRRQAPVMRKAGWHVSDEVNLHDKIVRWTITAPADGEENGNPDPQHPQHPQDVSEQGEQADGAAGHLRVSGSPAGHAGQAPMFSPPGNPQPGSPSTSANTTPAGVAGVAGQQSPISLPLVPVIPGTTNATAWTLAPTPEVVATVATDTSVGTVATVATADIGTSRGVATVATASESPREVVATPPTDGPVTFSAPGVTVARCCKTSGPFMPSCGLCPNSPNYWKKDAA
jgi:hypothetical protein